MLPVLLLAFAVSILVCVLAAARGSAVTLALAAALFAVQVLLVLLRINAPLWRGAEPASADLEWAWSNSVLAAFVYAWGAAAMFSIYSLTGLVWRHWWQYGAGMALFAAGALLCAAYLLGPRAPYDPPKSLSLLMGVTAAQAVAVVGALVYLIGSGKLATTKADWAANHIFLAGGTAIALISLASLLTYRRRAAIPASV
jgi:hypothetical protein